MSSRYTTVDIVVGVGMCAILFSALLFFVAADGTYQVVIPQPLASEVPNVLDGGLSQLQLVIGQAVVDGAIFERRANETITERASEWNRATMAQHNFLSAAGGPFGSIMQRVGTVPADHHARVQGVMGREIVNFTRRGVRSGLLSADLSRSDYNTVMIRTVEARGQRLHEAFTSTWQSTLGRNIVEAFQSYTARASAIQERLGSALVRLAQGQYSIEQERAAIQTQWATLVTAVVRSQALSDRLTLLAAIESFPEDDALAFTEPATWPEISMGHLIALGFLLMVIFFGGILLSGRIRETQALAEMRYNAAKWVYRPAA